MKITRAIDLEDLGYETIASSTTNDSIIRVYKLEGKDGERDDFAIAVLTSHPGSMADDDVEYNLSFDEAMSGFTSALRFDLIES